MKLYSSRLQPFVDLKKSIEKIAKANSLNAASIVTCVGSLKKVTIRMAGAAPENQDIRTYDGHYEIVSLTGTVSISGCHLHILFSDKEGVVIGGHLKEGTFIHTTAEIVLIEDEHLSYKRLIDEQTGFEELEITNRN